MIPISCLVASWVLLPSYSLKTLALQLTPSIGRCTAFNRTATLMSAGASITYVQ